MYEKLNALQKEIRSNLTPSSALDPDKISGVYIKYAIEKGNALTDPIMACDLLDFVSGHMDTNTLLVQKMSAENREKVADAQVDIAKAEDLFLGEQYARMLLECGHNGICGIPFGSGQRNIRKRCVYHRRGCFHVRFCSNPLIVITCLLPSLP